MAARLLPERIRGRHVLLLVAERVAVMAVIEYEKRVVEISKQCYAELSEALLISERWSAELPDNPDLHGLALIVPMGGKMLIFRPKAVQK